MVLVSAKDHYFMIGYRAAMKAYEGEKTYKYNTKIDIKADGLYQTWTSYDPYLFANYLEIVLPEDEMHRDYIYQGIETAMDNFLLKCYTEMEESTQ